MVLADVAHPDDTQSDSRHAVEIINLLIGCYWKNSKRQTPNFRENPSSNGRHSERAFHCWNLDFEVSMEFGVWSLAFLSFVDSWAECVNYLGHEGVDSVHFLVRLAGALLAVGPGSAGFAALDLADRLALPNCLMRRSRNAGADLCVALPSGALARLSTRLRLQIFANHFSGFLIIAQSQKNRLPQMTVPGPFGETHLTNQLRL